MKSLLTLTTLKPSYSLPLRSSLQRTRLRILRSANAARISRLQLVGILSAMLLGLCLSACSGKSDSDSKTAAASTPQKQTATDTPAASGKPSGGADTFSLSSSAFSDGAKIPRQYTCKGDNLSPPLSWRGQPEGTARFALLVDDENAPCGKEDNACKHWQLYNIPASKTSLAEGEQASAIDGATQGINWDASQAYSGPCPPNPHSYTFSLFALGENAPLIKDRMSLTRSQFGKLYSQHILATAELRGNFDPGNP